MKCAEYLTCSFPAVAVKCDAPGCADPDPEKPSGCARHLVQRGCDSCGKLLCVEHAFGCGDCEENLRSCGRCVAEDPGQHVIYMCADCVCARCGYWGCEFHEAITIFACCGCKMRYCNGCADSEECVDCLGEACVDCMTRCAECGDLICNACAGDRRRMPREIRFEICREDSPFATCRSCRDEKS